MSLPLTGIKVLDFTHLLPGELCSTVLSDLGCDVVRIEPLQVGLAMQLPPIVEAESLYYWSIHRNKKRIGIDLKHREGRDIAHRLIRMSDALLENFRPGVMKRLGVSYTEAHKLNAKIIYCSISGYGHETSFSGRPGHDLNFLAEAGVLDAARFEDGPPVIPGALISDYMAALYAALAVVAALFAQHKTNQGKHIDISMFESALSTQQIMATALTYLGLTKDQAQFRYPAELPHYTVYECKDGKFIAIAPLEGPFWKTFCEKAGLEDIAQMVVKPQDPALSRRLAALMKEKTQTEWMAIFEHANCCVSPVNTITDALDSVPAKERHIVSHLEHPTLGSIPQIASPMLSQQERRRPYQSVDASDAEAIKLLKEIGYDNSGIKRLCDEGIIDLRHAKL